MQHPIILVALAILSSCLSGEAQTPATQAFLVPAHSEPATTLFRTSTPRIAPNPPLARYLPSGPVAQPTVGGISVYASTYSPAYEPTLGADYASYRSSQRGWPRLEMVKGPFITESRGVFAEFWRGRLQLDGFDSTVHMQSVQLGPSSAGSLLPVHDQAGLNSSAHGEGISLKFNFGRDAQKR
jgi:hypothetical protein